MFYSFKVCPYLFLWEREISVERSGGYVANFRANEDIME